MTKRAKGERKLLKAAAKVIPIVHRQRAKPAPKAVRAWAVCNGDVMLPWAVRSTRRDAIEEIEVSEGLNWRYLRQNGYRIIRVRIFPEGA